MSGLLLPVCDITAFTISLSALVLYDELFLHNNVPLAFPLDVALKCTSKTNL